jgi:hypothetical protein
MGNCWTNKRNSYDHPDNQDNQDNQDYLDHLNVTAVVKLVIIGTITDKMLLKNTFIGPPEKNYNPNLDTDLRFRSYIFGPNVYRIELMDPPNQEKENQGMIKPSNLYNYYINKVDIIFCVSNPMTIISKILCDDIDTYKCTCRVFIDNKPNSEFEKFNYNDGSKCHYSLDLRNKLHITKLFDHVLDDYEKIKFAFIR